MLKKEDISKIARLLRIDESKLSEALASEKEVALELVELSTLTAQELELRDKNNKALGYTEGKGAGEEMVIKELKRKHEVDIEGKDPSAFADAFKNKILSDAKIEPSQQLKEKQEALEKLQLNYGKLEGEKNSLQASLEQMGVKYQLLAAIPKNKLSGEELLAVMSANGYAFEKGENGIIAKLNGSVVRNEATQAEVSFSEVIGSFIAEKNFAEEDGGKRGRGGKTTQIKSIATSVSELKKQWEDEGKNVNSAEFQAACAEHSKNNPDFKFE